MAYGLVQTSAPAEEPVTLSEAKVHVRVEETFTEDDGLITALVTAAREYVEKHTGRQLVTANWRLTLDEFPLGWRTLGVPWIEGDAIRLPRPPLRSVAAVRYKDTAGVIQTLAATAYQVDTQQEPGRIRPAYGEIWPTPRVELNAVTIDYVAGYGDADDVPKSIKQAIKLLAGHWYDSREAVAVQAGSPLAFALEALLGMAWTGEYV